MKEKESEYVKINIMRYNDLIVKKERYDTLIIFILDKSRLSYDKKRLVLEDNNILDIIKSLCPLLYKCKLEELQEIKDNKEN